MSLDSWEWIGKIERVFQKISICNIVKSKAMRMRIFENINFGLNLALVWIN